MRMLSMKSYKLIGTAHTEHSERHTLQQSVAARSAAGCMSNMKLRHGTQNMNKQTHNVLPSIYSSACAVRVRVCVVADGCKMFTHLLPSHYQNAPTARATLENRAPRRKTPAYYIFSPARYSNGPRMLQRKKTTHEHTPVWWWWWGCCAIHCIT